MAATGPCNISFTGIPVENYTEPASAGWNMIAVVRRRLRPLAIICPLIRRERVSGQIYGYDPAQGRYETPVSCMPGCGYWVSVSENCEICLSLT